MSTVSAFSFIIQTLKCFFFLNKYSYNKYRVVHAMISHQAFLSHNLFVINVMCLIHIQLTGVLDDCFCDVESIDVFNNFQIFPLLQKLTEKDYFRYYRVRAALCGTLSP